MQEHNLKLDRGHVAPHSVKRIFRMMMITMTLIG
jgi:hypothetical protein